MESKVTKEYLPTSIFLMLVLFVLTIGLSCRVVWSEPDEPTPTDTEEVIPSDTVAPPTAEPPTAQPPTEIPPTTVPTEDPSLSSIINPNASQPGDIYYAEPFEGLDNWTERLVKGNEGGVAFQAFDNRLRVQIETQHTWMYYFFEGGDFTDVRIDVQVENRASNTNFVGVICRYSGSGWYEVNVLNTGEYFIYYFFSDSGGLDLYTMYEDGTYDIRTGRKINDYIVICKGEVLTLVINGREQVSLPLKTGDYPFLPEGQVGISVSTTSVIPVVVDFLKFVLSVP